MPQLFYYKMRHTLVTKCARFFNTKCDSIVKKCDSYYKMQRIYYIMWQLLQNATFIIKCVGTKADWFLIVEAKQTTTMCI